MSQRATTAQGSGKQYGITPPISTNPPTQKDLELTTSLIETLKESNFFELEEESVKREIVLGKLNVLVKEFVKKVGISQGMSESTAAESGGKIFTFGSYRLGVHNKGADIDTLCVAPQHVSRTDFFTLFYELLQNTPEVTELTQVPDAYVPIMKLVYDTIPIDLLFARLNLAIIPEDLSLLDHNLLKNLDEKCILSLNGSRATDEILGLVPNISTFHTALRCIKLWAKRRALYNNAMGYVAGVACAILTARICQLYPNAAASKIVSRFFAIYYSWNWPQPILLKPLEDYQLNMKVWNPRLNTSDRNHRMPVITPAYPSMCSTHNVSSSTLRIMVHEFDRGRQITDKIEEGKLSWLELFNRTDFFYRYRQYIQIIAVSTTAEMAHSWSGFVESKIRLFVGKLEQLMFIVAAPPFPERFERKCQKPSIDRILPDLFYTPETEHHQHVNDVNSSEVNKENETTPEMKEYYVSTFYIGLEIQPPNDSIPGPRKLNLAGPVAEFKRLAVTWDRYKLEMELYIREIKRMNLPEEVYEGHPRPKRAPKRPLEHILESPQVLENTQGTEESTSADTPKKLKLEDSSMKVN